MSDEGFRHAADAYLREAASTMQATLEGGLGPVNFEADGDAIVVGKPA